MSFRASSLSLRGSAPWYPQFNHAQAAFSNEDLLTGGSAASHVSGVLTIVLIFIENVHNCILHFLTLTDHVKSTDHRHAIAAEEKGQTWGDVQVKSNLVKRRSAITLAFKTCYWLITQDVANCKYNPMVEVLREQQMNDALFLNRGANASYDSTNTFNNLMGCLGGVVETKLKQQLRQSPFIGIGIDESTDRATEKHLAIVVRYISSTGKCMTQFLDCVAVRDGKAATVVHAVDVTMKIFGVPMTKIIGLGSDGTSVMASDIRGVNGMLKKQHPFLVFEHCVAHRLNLAVSQSCNAISGMATLQNVIVAVYNFVQLSPKRLTRFKEIAAVLSMNAVTFQRLYEIR